ncbi:Zn-ribbon domain-containing OB-fold protein [Neobacillus sp. M.A.Huq-85]
MYKEAQPFWDGIKEHKLLLQRCKNCEQFVFYPRTFCPHDLGELEYEEVEAAGKIISYSVVNRCGEPSLIPYLPYVAALIELDCGPKIFGRLVEVPLPLVHSIFGQRVKGKFVKQGEEDMLAFALE